MKGARQRWSYPGSKITQHRDQDDSYKKYTETGKPADRNSISFINTEKVHNPGSDDFSETIADVTERPSSETNSIHEEAKNSQTNEHILPLMKDKTGLSKNPVVFVIGEDPDDLPGNINETDQNSDQPFELSKYVLHQDFCHHNNEPSTKISKSEDKEFQTDDQENESDIDSTIITLGQKVSEAQRGDGIKSLFPTIETDSAANSVSPEYMNISQEDGELAGTIDPILDIPGNHKGTSGQKDINPQVDLDSVDIMKDSDSMSLTEDSSGISPDADIASSIQTEDSETIKSPTVDSSSSHSSTESPSPPEDKAPVDNFTEEIQVAVGDIDKDIICSGSQEMANDSETSSITIKEVEDNQGNDGYKEAGNSVPLVGWEDELNDELKLNTVITDNSLITDTDDEKNISTDVLASASKIHGHKREVVVLDLNALLVDVDKVRLSQLSDISEENDTQLEELSSCNGTYQVLESLVGGDATQNVDTILSDNLSYRLTVPESRSCADLPPIDDGLSVTSRAIDQSSDKSEAMSGRHHDSGSISLFHLQTKAIIEQSPSDETQTSSITEQCLDNRARNGITCGDNGDEEDTNLLPPKADLDSMDLIVEDDLDGARPDPQGSDSTSDLLDNPDASTNTGIQKATQAFIQNRYKTFSKRRVVYSTFIKYILFFFNFICWVAGVAAACAGYWMIVDKHKVVRDAIDFFLDPAIILSITGAIIFIVAFFGFVGALRENILLLKIWHISLSVFLVAELIFGTLVFLFYFFPDIRRDLALTPEDWGLKEAIRKYKDDKGMRDWIDMVQMEMKCCGVTNSDKGYKDWQENQYYKCSDSNPSPDRCNVPPSCCIILPGDYYNSMCGFNTNDKEVWQVETDIYTQGCVKGFGKWLQSNAVIIGAVFTGVVVPQFIGIVLARVYIKLSNLKKSRSRWKKWTIKSLARSFKKKDPEPTEV